MGCNGVTRRSHVGSYNLSRSIRAKAFPNDSNPRRQYNRRTASSATSRTRQQDPPNGQHGEHFIHDPGTDAPSLVIRMDCDIVYRGVILKVTKCPTIKGKANDVAPFK
jgi:hypothetical protein